MSEQNIRVIARMKAQQGKESRLRQELAALMPSPAS